MSIKVPGRQKLQTTCLTRSGIGCFITEYPRDNSGHQRVKTAAHLRHTSDR